MARDGHCRGSAVVRVGRFFLLARFMSILTPSRRQLFAEVWKLAWPIAGANFLLRGAAIVDTAFVGRLGQIPLAALGMAQIPYFLSMAVVRGLGVGAQVLVAYHTGAREPDRRLKVARAVVVLSVLVAVAVAALLLPASATILRWMGADQATVGEGMRFLYLYYAFFVFSGLFFVFSSIFQGAGDARTPLYVTIGVNALHVVVSYVFIYGEFGCPQLGIMGAALGLGISELAGTIVLAVLAIRRGLWGGGLRNLSLGAAKAVGRLGGPTAGERLLVNGMQGFYLRMITGFGYAAIGAHRIGVDMEAVSFLPALGFGQAATTLVGQRLGAGDPEGARRAGWMTTWIALGFMSALGLSFLIFARQWIGLFTDDPEVVRLGMHFCVVAAAIQAPLALALTLAGALRGAGETRWVMMMPLLGGWLVRLPLAYLFGYVLGFGLWGVWWMMFADWLVRGSMIAIKFKTMSFRLADRVGAPTPAPVVATRDLAT